MSGRLIVPPMEPEPYPTLGPQVVEWVEEHLVHGPGDVLGEPARLNDELAAFVYRAYEIFPRDHSRAGRRRFKRCVLSRRKGFAKTELMAWLAIAELDPDAPVRCRGWTLERGEYVPVGGGVHDPFIPLVAVTEEQSSDLAFGAAKEILERCALGNRYVITQERIVHRDAPGKMQAYASAPGARDGARTTFQGFDETHGMVRDRLIQAHQTMLRNIPKRAEADAWSLETSTMYAPGEGSVAEGSHEYALAVLQGQLEDAGLLFDHRQATIDVERPLRRVAHDKVLAAIREASGDAVSFADVDAIYAQLLDPRTDEGDFRRYWLNQRVRSSRRWLDPDAWAALAKHRRVPDGADVVLGFDGSYNRDSTALVGATIEETPHLFVVEAWERPMHAPANWRVSRLDVEEAIRAAMERFTVRELAPDPSGWYREIEEWEEEYGAPPVVRFEMKKSQRFGPACSDMEQAVADAGLTHDGSEILARHIANCTPVLRNGYRVVTKEAQDSPNKIDVALAAILAHHRALWHHTNTTDAEVLMAYA